MHPVSALSEKYKAEMQEWEMKRRERHVYANLRRRGFGVRKTPWNHWSLANIGRGYHVYSGYDRHNIVLGGGFGGYSATIEDVEKFAGVVWQEEW